MTDDKALKLVDIMNALIDAEVEIKSLITTDDARYMQQHLRGLKRSVWLEARFEAIDLCAEFISKDQKGRRRFLTGRTDSHQALMKFVSWQLCSQALIQVVTMLDAHSGAALRSKTLPQRLAGAAARSIGECQRALWIWPFEVGSPFQDVE